jgi:hypothetical protein
MPLADGSYLRLGSKRRWRLQTGMPKTSARRLNMLWTIVAILLIMWLLGFSFHIAGSLVHLLLVIALVVIVINLLSGRRSLV